MMAKTEEAVEVTLPNGTVARLSFAQFLEYSRAAVPSKAAPAAPTEPESGTRRVPHVKGRTRQFLKALATSRAGLNAAELVSLLSLGGGVKAVSGEILSARQDLKNAGLRPEDYFFKGPENRWRCNGDAVAQLLAHQAG